MDHDRARELFTDYLDGELGSEDREALEKHLAECAACNEEWESYSKTVGEVSGLLRVAAPDSFAKDVEQKIKRRSKGRFFADNRSYSLQFAVVSFILILLFILAYLVMTSATEITVMEQPEADGGINSGERASGGR